ncbi:MAG: hypothetical protein R3F65_21710 [bacterium]
MQVTKPEHLLFERHAVLADLTRRLMVDARLDAPPPEDRPLSHSVDSLALIAFLTDVRRAYHVELGPWLAESVRRGGDTLDGLCHHVVGHGAPPAG